MITPDQLRFRESWLAARDGTRLFLRTREAVAEAKGGVLLLHGMGEHSSRYLHVAERLSAAGWCVWLFDLRGHGRSDGARGGLRSYADFVEDLDLVCAEASRDGAPLFVYAHSLGAQIAFNWIAARRPKIRGLVAASPWLDLAFKPRRRQLAIARLALWFRPDFTQATELRPERLSRDLEFLGALPDPDLTHHRVSARMFAELSRGAQGARDSAATFTLPLLMLHGDADPVTSVKATRAFYERALSPDKTLLIYQDGLHETHNDLDRERVLGDVVAWLAARSERQTE